jgi:hypothetical protein
LLPVYADIGGVLLLGAKVTVLVYDPETGIATRTDDAAWRTAALVRAAQPDPELASLMLDPVLKSL